MLSKINRFVFNSQSRHHQQFIQKLHINNDNPQIKRFFVYCRVNYSNKPHAVGIEKVLFIDADGKNQGLCDFQQLQENLNSGIYGKDKILVQVSNSHKLNDSTDIVHVYKLQAISTSADDKQSTLQKSPQLINDDTNQFKKEKEIKISESIGENDLKMKTSKIVQLIKTNHPVKVLLEADRKKRHKVFSLSQPKFEPNILEKIKVSVQTEIKGVKVAPFKRQSDYQWISLFTPSKQQKNEK